jgi:Cu(I)/Ag(I) efflux system membrane fusion protein
MAAEHEETFQEGPEPAPPGARTMAAIRWAILVGTIFLAAGSFWSWAHAGSPDGAPAQVRPKYRCPMHPQVTSDRPGECPICHMDLVPIPDAEQTPEPAPSGAPADAGAPSTHVHVPGMAMGSSAPPSLPPPPHLAPVTLSFDRIQAMGVRTAVAEERTVDAPLRLSALVEAPEDGVAEVHVRTPGFVERIAVDRTSVEVRAGQPLAWIYSPEVHQAESELLAMRGFGDAGARSASAARTKLELLGVSSAEIDAVVEHGTPQRAHAIVAPRSGWVVKKTAVLGAYATPETALYTIQDLSRVWVVASVYPADVSRVRVGSQGRFSPSRDPAVVLGGTAQLLEPIVDTASRTTRVRFVLPNAHGALRPGDWGSLEIAGTPEKRVVVPRDAIVDTGRETYAFVALGEGRFEPRMVRVGARLGDVTAVSEGIAPGERVVSGATFLLDSESRLRASVTPGAHAGHGGAP